MNRTEGGYLKDFLKRNKINQEDLAQTMGMSRQGLRYHFTKEKIDYEFKMKLREHGVTAFDENGKIGLSYEEKDKHIHSSSAHADSDLKDKLIKLLEERVELLIEKGRKDEEKIRELEAKLLKRGLN